MIRLEQHAVPTCGLPYDIEACLFDLDGVLTDTARIHRHAWAAMFDEFLRTRARSEGVGFVPFDPVADYDRFIDGKLRSDGVRAFLASRGIGLPDGERSDPPTALTVCGLGNRKEKAVLSLIASEGVRVFPGSVRYLESACAAGLRRAVVSASTNCRAVLRRAKLDGLVEVVVDGRTARTGGLCGKPAPDTYLRAAHLLHVLPERAAIFEDSLAGVEAGRAGGFGFIVAISRSGRPGEFLSHGASIVVSDLSDLLEART